MPPLHFYLKYDPPPPLGGTSNPPPGLKTFCIQTNIQNIQTNKQRPFPIIHQTRRHPATHHQGSRHFVFKTNKDKHGKNFNYTKTLPHYPPNSEAPSHPPPGILHSKQTWQTFQLLTSHCVHSFIFGASSSFFPTKLLAPLAIFFCPTEKSIFPVQR